nr:VWA domain-containing protein [Deltaproteobacteria bacterium]
MRTWVVFAVFTMGCGSEKAVGGDDPDPDPGFCDANVACPAGQTCSSQGICMPEGACVVEEDCADGTFCSGNQNCITDGNCVVDVDCGAGMLCGEDATCSIGGCGGQLLDLTYVPPNLVLVVDRSCSMNSKIANTNTTKWEAAVAAIETVVGDYADDVRWGLTLFPDTIGQSCAQDGAMPFPVGPNNTTGIVAMLNAGLVSTDPLFPDGPCVTNIDTGIQQAA